MRSAVSLFMLIGVAIASEPCESATIRLVKNRYSPYDSFLRQYASTRGLIVPKERQWTIGGNTGDDSGISRLNINNLAYDEHQGCDQLKYALFYDQAISIEGQIEPKDGAELDQMLEQTAKLKGSPGCALPVLINSSGGDLATAIKIGRRLRMSSRFVIVPDGASCLSSCVFILLAARYEDNSTNVSNAVAFSNSTIGIHAPAIQQQDSDGLRLLSTVDPNQVLQFFGRYWSDVNNYAVEMTQSTWFSVALANAISLPPDHLYIIDSALERKLAGISTIVLPTADDKLVMDTPTLRNVCLFELIEPYAQRVRESLQFELHRDDIYVLYYPAKNRICFARTDAHSIQLIVEPYPLNYSDETNSPKQTKPPGRRAVQSALWDELSKLGLPRERLGTNYGIGKSIAALAPENLKTTWGIFARLTAGYSCTVCGSSQGTIVFSNDDNQCNADDDAKSSQIARRYIDAVRSKGFRCDTQLATYIYAKARFRFKLVDTALDLDEMKVVPAMLRGGSVNISRDCRNESGVCSLTTGSIVDGRLRVGTKKAE